MMRLGVLVELINNMYTSIKQLLQQYNNIITITYNSKISVNININQYKQNIQNNKGLDSINYQVYNTVQYNKHSMNINGHQPDQLLITPTQYYQYSNLNMNKWNKNHRILSNIDIGQDILLQQKLNQDVSCQYYNKLIVNQQTALKQLQMLDQIIGRRVTQTDKSTGKGIDNKQLDDASSSNHLQYLQYLREHLRSQEQYPQLFEGNAPNADESLFVPDQCFYGSNTVNINTSNQSNDLTKLFKRYSEASEYKATSSAKCLPKSKQKLTKCPRKQQQNESQQKIFQQYLDSLQINQLLSKSSGRQSSSNNILSNHSKNCSNSMSHKNLQSPSTSLECTFKPSILKKSQQIAAGLAPSFQRLTMPIRNGNTSNIQNSSNTNAHSLNAGMSGMIGNRKTPYKPKQYQKQFSKQHLQQLSKPRVLKTEPNECQPESGSQYFGAESKKTPMFNYMDVAIRNQVWQEQKQQKILKLRKQQEENRNKKQASTFAPKITQYKVQTQQKIGLSQFGKIGLVNYFQRVGMGRAKGKQNINIAMGRRDSISPYGSNSQNLGTNMGVTKTPKKEKDGTPKVKVTTMYSNTKIKKRAVCSNNNKNQKLKYDQAVKQLHKKLMSLNI